MNFEVTKNDNSSVTLKIEGRIDANSAGEFKEQINKVSENAETIILDFSKVEYISSSGLRVILDVQKRIASQRMMKIIKPNQSVMDIFNAAGFSNVLPIVPD